MDRDNPEDENPVCWDEGSSPCAGQASQIAARQIVEVGLILDPLDSGLSVRTGSILGCNREIEEAYVLDGAILFVLYVAASYSSVELYIH